MRTILKIIMAGVALGLGWRLGNGGASSAGGAGGAASQPTSRPALPEVDQFRGMAVQLHGGAGVYDAYHRLVPEVAGLGANAVLFVVHGWQNNAGSPDLRIDTQRSADAEELGRLCDLAHERGLRVILMPIVLLSSPRTGEWRGKIVPSDRDWDAWFRRYTVFIVHWAKVADRYGVEVLMVGSELIKTETYTERWQAVIAEVRRHYGGRLGYSANWDHYQTAKIGFWPQLDCVGMTSYYELASKPNPAIEEIDANWRDYQAEILAFQKEVRKPIIFTEVGWCSQEGAAHEGWNYYANQKATEAGRREQALLYESFLKTWADEPSVAGILWWEWDLSPGGDADYNYTPRGKPAEKILRDWFAERRDGAATER